MARCRRRQWVISKYIRIISYLRFQVHGRGPPSRGHFYFCQILVNFILVPMSTSGRKRISLNDVKEDILENAAQKFKTEKKFAPEVVSLFLKGVTEKGLAEEIARESLNEETNKNVFSNVKTKPLITCK
ncbi:uncharacterized protein LOC143255381 [Tachypleus tridentatus]|uniref:uncharacterized protein LOC143255381 n=1 Tax=Tachypleus tridentatus TaxID=6853 RepID=UPI003FD51B24